MGRSRRRRGAELDADADADVAEGVFDVSDDVGGAEGQWRRSRILETDYVHISGSFGLVGSCGWHDGRGGPGSES